MKFKGILSSTLLVLFGTSLVWAGDPWKEKPWTEWTEKDVRKVLDKSPWAHRTRFSIIPTLTRPSGPGVAEQRGGSMPAGQWENEQVAAEASGMPPSGGPMPQPSLGPDRLTTGSYMVIRWLSSRTVREAIARHWQLTSPGQADESAKRVVSMELESYMISLSLPWPLSFSGTGMVRETAYLKLLPSGKKVGPVLVQKVKKNAVIAPAADLLVHFPKELEGQPVFTPKETRVEFHFDYGDPKKPRHAKVKFDLGKMVRGGQSDL